MEQSYMEDDPGGHQYLDWSEPLQPLSLVAQIS
jgi:hypothetical protein